MDPADVQMLAVFRKMQETARTEGPVVLDHMICGSCGLNCMYIRQLAGPKSGMQCPRCGFEVLAPDEICHHAIMCDLFFEAAQELKDTYPVDIFGSGDEKIDHLPAETKQLIASKAGRAARTACDTIINRWRALCGNQFPTKDEDDGQLGVVHDGSG